MNAAPSKPVSAAVYYEPGFEAAFLHPRYASTWMLLGLLRLAVLLPRSWVAWLGARAGDLFYRVSEKRRRIADTNLTLCFPKLPEHEREALVRAHFRIFIQCLFDAGLLWWASRRYLDRYVRVRGLERYAALHRGGKRIILLTAHFVALEIGGIVLSRHFPQIGLTKREKNRLLDYFMARGRRRFLGRVFLRQQGMRPVVRAIKEGFGFYYLPDEDLGPERSIFLPFFATQAATITALPRLAKLSDAVVMPCVTRRLSAGEGYEIDIRPPLDNYPSDDDATDAARMNHVLEDLIREMPDQYMWTLKLFRTRPPGEPSPY